MLWVTDLGGTVHTTDNSYTQYEGGGSAYDLHAASISTCTASAHSASFAKILHYYITTVVLVTAQSLVEHFV